MSSRNQNFVATLATSVTEKKQKKMYVMTSEDEDVQVDRHAPRLYTVYTSFHDWSFNKDAEFGYQT